jgi:hypothetical protein
MLWIGTMGWVFLTTLLMMGAIAICGVLLGKFLYKYQKAKKRHWPRANAIYKDRFLLLFYQLGTYIYIIPSGVISVILLTVYMTTGNYCCAAINIALNFISYVLIALFLIFFGLSSHQAYLYCYGGYLFTYRVDFPIKNITSINFSQNKKAFFIVYFEFNVKFNDRLLYINNPTLEAFVRRLALKERIIHHRYSRFF